MIKNSDMIKFELETGKKALWNGEITQNYTRWIKGEKLYYRKNDKRVSLYISANEKVKWAEFINANNDVKGFSDLIRLSVREYIESRLYSHEDRRSYDFHRISHALKEPLTNVKGYAQIILEQYENELHDNLYANFIRIVNSCDVLEKRINEFCGNKVQYTNKCDILIVDDNLQMINLLEEYFIMKNYNVQGVLNGVDVLNLLSSNKPKVIILDVMLNDSNGIDLCRLIRQNPDNDKISIFLITALPPDSFEKTLNDIKIDGFIFKPFDLVDLEPILEVLRTEFK